jgi:hypothetical protein
MPAKPEIELYPVRPRWQPGDSMAGYCWHILAVNGYAPVTPGAVKGLWTKRNLCRVDQTMAGRLFGADLADACYENEERLVRDAVADGRFGSRATRHRFCPLCMADHRRHKIIWDLPLIAACADHGCMLIDRCDHCYRPLNWTQIGPEFTCSCDRVLSEAAQPAARAQWCFAIAVARGIDAHAMARATMRREGSRRSSGIDYAVRDVYELLGWADSWTLYRRNGAPPRPGLLRRVASDPERMVAAMWRCLRHKRRGSQDVLIDVERDDRTNRWFLTKDRISRSSNPLLSAVEAAVADLHKGYDACIESLPGVAFEPSLSPEECGLLDARLSHWWTNLAQRVPAAECEPLVGTPASAANRLHLLNRLYDAALLDVPVDALSTLAARWQMPLMLQSASLPRQLAAGLGQLHVAEHDFVLALIKHDLEKWHRSMGDAAGPREERPDD